MTDHQPDRPDGDGLRAKLIEFDSFLNEPPSYEDKTMVRDYRHSAYAKWSSLCADIVKLIDAPTRDGAEDAGEPSRGYMTAEQIAADKGIIRTVPPKPAPDAMREALQAIADLEPGTQQWVDDAVLESEVRLIAGQAIRLAKAALSAPVPPADGALGVEAMLADERVEWRNDLHKRAADRDLEKRTIDLSPAVAAERTLLDRPSRLGEKRVFGPDASPPVRGDREAIAVMAVAPHPCFCCGGKLHLNGASYACDKQSSETFGIDDVSLRVQPGAGEREAIILECADLAAKFEDCSADFIADKLREFASRQAPHSSGETVS